MDSPVRRHNLLHVNRIRVSFEIRDPPASFHKNHEARRRIPRTEIQFPETVATAQGGVAHVESSCTAAAHTLTLHDRRFKLAHGETAFRAIAIGTTGCEQD